MTETGKSSMFWQLTWKVLVLCLITFVVGIFFTDWISWGLGVLLGGGFTILRLKWMDISVAKAVERESDDAKHYFTLQYMLRYLLSFGVLALAAVVPQINLFSAMIAMFMLKIATYIQGFFEKRAPKDGSVVFEEWVDEEEEEEEDWDRWETYNLKVSRREARKKNIPRYYKVEPETQEASDETESTADDGQTSLFDEPVSKTSEASETGPDDVMEDQISLFDDIDH